MPRLFLLVSVSGEVKRIVSSPEQTYLISAYSEDKKVFGSLGNMNEQQYRKVLEGSKVTKEQLENPIHSGQSGKLGGDGLFFSEEEINGIGIVHGEHRRYRG